MIVRSSLYEDSTRTTLQEQSKELQLERVPAGQKGQVFEAVHESCPQGSTRIKSERTRKIV